MASGVMSCSSRASTFAPRRSSFLAPSMSPWATYSWIFIERPSCGNHYAQKPHPVGWPDGVSCFTLGKKWFRLAPSKAARGQTAVFKKSAGTTRAEIVPPQLLFQQLVAVDDPHPSFDVRFGREAF